MDERISAWMKLARLRVCGKTPIFVLGRAGQDVTVKQAGDLSGEQTAKRNRERGTTESPLGMCVTGASLGSSSNLCTISNMPLGQQKLSQSWSKSSSMPRQERASWGLMLSVSIFCTLKERQLLLSQEKRRFDRQYHTEEYGPLSREMDPPPETLWERQLRRASQLICSFPANGSRMGPAENKVERR